MRLTICIIVLAFALASAHATTPQPVAPESAQLLVFAEDLGDSGPLAPLDTQIAEATRLIDAGASLTATDSDGRTALHLAAGSGSLRAPEFMQLLLDRGAPIDAADTKGRTALMHAAANGFDHNILFLVLAGADPAAEDVSKFTALDHALQFGQRSPASPIAITLLTKTPAPSSRGADPNHIAADGWTPLMRACQFSGGAAIGTLMLFGADPNYVAPDGWTPITIAIASDDERYWVQWMNAWAKQEGIDQPIGDMAAAMFASWARGTAGSPERVWALMRIDARPLDVAVHQVAIDRVLKGRDDPSASAVRAILALDDDLNVRPIMMPLFGNDGGPIPAPE